MNIIKVIGTLISILLLLIGNVSAENNGSDIIVEDSINNAPNDTQSSSEGAESIVDTTGEDTDGSSVVEDIVLEDTQVTQTEKKSSPGFESIVTIIAFLSLIITVIRRRR